MKRSKRFKGLLKNGTNVMSDEIEKAWQQLFKEAHNEHVKKKRRGASTMDILAMKDSLHRFFNLMKKHRKRQFDEMEAVEGGGSKAVHNELNSVVAIVADMICRKKQQDGSPNSVRILKSVHSFLLGKVEELESGEKGFQTTE